MPIRLIFCEKDDWFLIVIMILKLSSKHISARVNIIFIPFFKFKINKNSFFIHFLILFFNFFLQGLSIGTHSSSRRMRSQKF